MGAGKMPSTHEITRTDADFAVRRKKKRKLKEPEDYKVILLNDDYTAMDFVVEVIMSVFHKTEEDAAALMLDVHQKGRAVVGVYTLDIAQTKTAQVHEMAAENDYPLKCIIEKA
jgi:ATP-dependent Clp protease adaptor protein ClpS